MCTVSMIMDYYGDKWQRRLNEYYPASPFIPNPFPPVVPNTNFPVVQPLPAITTEEIKEFRELLERAREYDRKHSQPDCELDEKKQALKKIAEKMGVEISFV